MSLYSRFACAVLPDVWW